MSRSTLRTILAAGLVAAGSFFLSSCFLFQSEPEGIVIGITNLPDSLNPVGEQNITGMNANELLFDGLVNFEVDLQSGARYSEFALAEDIVQDPATKKIYTVTLKDVDWHDSTAEAPHKVTAEDVIFSFNAYMDPANNSPQRSYLDSFIAGITKVDNVEDPAYADRVVAIEFRKPIPEFRVFSFLTFKIIPSMRKDASGKMVALATDMRSGKLEREFATAPVGTGPFRFATWEIGKWVTFKANTTYFRKKPAANDLVLRSIIDPVIRMNEFQKRNINLILETSPMDRPAVEKMDKSTITVSSFLPYSFYQVAINTTRDAFAGTDARKALVSAVDAASLIPGITDDASLALVNHGPFPQNILERNSADYFPEPLSDPWLKDSGKIKALATSSGLAGRTVSLMFPDSMGDFGQQICDGIAAQLAQVGVTVEVKRTGDQVFRRLVNNDHDFDMALQYCEGFDNWYGSLDKYYVSGGELNVSGIADPELDQLFDWFNSRSLVEDMFKAVHGIHDKVTGLAPAIPLFSLQKDVYSRGINNIVIASDNPFLSVEEWAQAVK